MRTKTDWRRRRCGGAALCGLLLTLRLAAQENAPGHAIGSVSLRGDLIVLELADGALGTANLFDLVGRTLRFEPSSSNYRVENLPLRWDSHAGQPVEGATVVLRHFEFPFSGQLWRTIRVGTTGTLRFGGAGNDLDPYGHSEAGVALGRFEELADAASAVIASAPAICVFLKPRLSGPRFVKELSDRVVITWDLTEPFGNLLDFSWFKTTNRFQAVLYRDGTIEFSYQELAAKDAIVGIYPLLRGAPKLLATLSAEAHPLMPPPLDIRQVRVSQLGSTLLRVSFESRGLFPKVGDPALAGSSYRVLFAALPTHPGGSAPSVAWRIECGADPDHRGEGVVQCSVSGPGVIPQVVIAVNSLTIEGVVPPWVRTAERVTVSAEVGRGGDHTTVAAHLAPQVVRLNGIRGPDVHLSSLKRRDGPFAMVYEAFHYLTPPRPQDLSCTILGALGDAFDFLAYYSDARLDSQEASPPSDGPLGGGVTGIGQTEHDLGTYCTHGRFQTAYTQPVYVDANEMQERPPECAPVAGVHDITSYVHRLAEISPGAKLRPYDYAVGHLGHEVGHRWGAYVTAKVKGQTLPLGPSPHWGRGLQAQVAFPYQQLTEASTLGGSVWQDNSDGTYTQLHDGYFVPATGYSALDLYLMGLVAAAEVPDFFLLQNLEPTGKDAAGHPIFKADRVNLKIGNVIAAEGQRHPDVSSSQKAFNTGIVVVVEHGKSPSERLLVRAKGIGQQWLDYWSTTTGHRSSMTIKPR